MTATDGGLSVGWRWGDSETRGMLTVSDWMQRLQSRGREARRQTNEDKLKFGRTSRQRGIVRHGRHTAVGCVWGVRRRVFSSGNGRGGHAGPTGVIAQKAKGGPSEESELCVKLKLNLCDVAHETEL